MRTWFMAVSVVLLLCAEHTISTTQEGAPAARTVATDQPGSTFRECAECPEMVVLPAGDFIMGSAVSEKGREKEEGPERRVDIRRFAVGKFHVTRGQWASFVSATKRKTSGGCAWSRLPTAKGDEPDASASWRDFGYPQDDAHPVVCLAFQDAQDYVGWLSGRTGHGYRLLTEAEWEYAARAGSTTAYPWGSSASHEQANYGAETCCSGVTSGRDQWLYSSPAGSFPPNTFGLYDMHGNVMQWVQDCFASSYEGLPSNGSAYEEIRTLNLTGDLSFMTGMTSCSYRILRGGGWADPPAMIRSAARNFAPPPGATLQDYKSTGTGFRVARSLD
jgi:formylglycine-generating enzyme required for sulfatase activity